MGVLKDSLVVFTEGARVNFGLDGRILPVFAGVLDGEPQTFGVPWESPADKDEFASKVREWIASGRLSEYVLVAEAWSVDVDPSERHLVSEHLSRHGSLQDYPGRTEVAVVTYCSPAEEIEYTASIERGKFPVMGSWVSTRKRVGPSSDDFSARFGGLYTKGKAGQN